MRAFGEFMRETPTRATEERKSMIERVVDWTRVEKDTARRMQDSRTLDPGRRAYWTNRY